MKLLVLCTLVLSVSVLAVPAERDDDGEVTSSLRIWGRRHEFENGKSCKWDRNCKSRKCGRDWGAGRYKGGLRCCDGLKRKGTKDYCTGRALVVPVSRTL